jgi:hypothetical protein
MRLFCPIEDFLIQFTDAICFLTLYQTKQQEEKQKYGKRIKVRDHLFLTVSFVIFNQAKKG